MSILFLYFFNFSDKLFPVPNRTTASLTSFLEDFLFLYYQKLISQFLFLQLLYTFFFLLLFLQQSGAVNSLFLIVIHLHKYTLISLSHISLKIFLHSFLHFSYKHFRIQSTLPLYSNSSFFIIVNLEIQSANANYRSPSRNAWTLRLS